MRFKDGLASLEIDLRYWRIGIDETGKRIVTCGKRIENLEGEEVPVLDLPITENSRLNQPQFSPDEKSLDKTKGTKYVNQCGPR